MSEARKQAAKWLELKHLIYNLEQQLGKAKADIEDAEKWLETEAENRDKDLWLLGDVAIVKQYDEYREHFSIVEVEKEGEE